jgi:hypothetical protein
MIVKARSNEGEACYFPRVERSVARGTATRPATN